VRIVGLTNYRMILMKSDNDIYSEEKRGLIIKKAGTSALSVYFKYMFYDLGTFNRFSKLIAENNKKIWDNYTENGKSTGNARKVYKDPSLFKSIAIVTDIGFSNDNARALTLKKVTPENIDETDNSWNGYYFKLIALTINNIEWAATLKAAGKNLKSKFLKFNSSIKMTMVISPIKKDQSDWYGLMKIVSAGSEEINNTFPNRKSVSDAYQAIYENI
ncbi:MAG: hypothetical protein ACP5UV_02910, partial [Thermoplasmata archaeon]